MNYREVIKSEYIEEYKEQHRIFYCALSSMIFDISFLETCVELQDHELDSDWITIKFLHRNLFENLISKVYKCFFDNSGKDSITLFRFKNNIVHRFIKEEYQTQILDNISKLSSEYDDFTKRKTNLEENLLALRRSFVAHRLLITDDDAVVDLREIKMLVEYGQKLFQTLSFRPLDFYSFAEGDGYDFSKEIEYTRQSLSKFIKTSFLTSKYIAKIDCELQDDCDDAIKERICAIISDLNTKKQKI